MKCLNHTDRDATGACVVCGRGVCAECQREVAGTLRCATHAVSVGTIVANGKSTFLSVVLSFFPGVGHLYLGAYQRGIFLALLFAGLITIESHGAGGLEPLFGIGIAFVWFFGVFDAVRICRAINSGAGEQALSGASIAAVPKISSKSGTLTWGVVLIGIGGLLLADRYVDLDRFFDFIDNNIGLIFIALGFVLLAAYSRSRAKARDSAETGLSITPPPSNPSVQS